jgi:hypothetical protein
VRIQLVRPYGGEGPNALAHLGQLRFAAEGLALAPELPNLFQEYFPSIGIARESVRAHLGPIKVPHGK